MIGYDWDDTGTDIELVQQYPEIFKGNFTTGWIENKISSALIVKIPGWEKYHLIVWDSEPNARAKIAELLGLPVRTEI